MEKSFRLIDDAPMSDEVVENAEPVGEPTAEELKAHEAALLAGVLSAAADNETYSWACIVRPDPKNPDHDKEYFRFRVRALDERRIKKMGEVYTTKTKNRAGIMVANGFKEPDFNTEFIYTATHPDDRKAIWDNPVIQKSVGVTGWRECIDKVLKAGEKEKVVELIAKISGYDDSATIELVKN